MRGTIEASDDRECQTCDQDIAGACLHCVRCSSHICGDCMKKVDFYGTGFQLEENNLAFTEDDEIEGFVTSLRWRESKLYDQRNHAIECEYNPTSFVALARLCSSAFIDAEFPASIETTMSHTNLPLFDVCDKLTGISDPSQRTDRVRLFGQKDTDGEEESTSLKMRIGSINGAWCIDVDLRKTAARPGIYFVFFVLNNRAQIVAPMDIKKSVLLQSTITSLGLTRMKLPLLNMQTSPHFDAVFQAINASFRSSRRCIAQVISNSLGIGLPD